jgi:hypothetical protein
MRDMPDKTPEAAANANPANVREWDCAAVGVDIGSRLGEGRSI